MATKIKITPERLEELYETLYSEAEHTKSMTASLQTFQKILEDQGLDSSSLALIHTYCGSLINMMELLQESQLVLQNNASEIAKEFTQTDVTLADSYGGIPSSPSYGQYQEEKFRQKHNLQY
ncbi:hypothetical protein V1498_20725 [Peribacillus sp. SCS-26]|uniref:hypothetical protein n=1 Tax=Paraperibacillus marinus TaxID=3115295 RepID=UPI0039060AB7